MVVASAYTPQVSKVKGLTSNGEIAVPHKTCAVSRDLVHLVGKTIHIENIGYRRVNDVMAARYKQSVDVCMADRESALEFGRRKVAVKVIR